MSTYPPQSRLPVPLDHNPQVGLATQRMVEGSTQELDHARLVRRMEFYDRLRQPLFFWPVIAAYVQVLAL